MYRDANETGDTGQAIEVFVESLHERFSDRAIQIAERQQNLAGSDDVARRWRLIAERLRHP